MARFSLLSVVLALISLLSLSSWARPAACRPRPRPQPGSPQLAPSGTHQPAPTSTTPTGTPQPTPDQTPPPAPGRNNVYLSEHNEFRARHGAAPLQWSDNLAQKAQQWANNCQFRHSGGSLGPFGENLAAGSGNFGAAAAVQSWTGEASQYDPNNPVPSHFTQVVWKSTTELGCAVAVCDGIFDASFGKAQFHVCEYSPPGNVIGRFPANVQP